MYITSRKAQLGLNLVELMIGLVVGMIVLAAMTVVYLNTTRGSKDTLNANRLNQDIRAVMDIMVSDIRRGGYWGTANGLSANPFTTRTGTATDTYLPSSNCILYSYDATYKDGDTTGTPSAAGVDSFGFRLSGNAVQTLTATSLVNNSNAAVCNNSGLTWTWNSLTDSKVINVSALTFSTEGSQCMNANKDTNADGVNDNWVVAAGGQSAACTDTTATGYQVPDSGNQLAETRQITITITANYVNPADATDTT